MECLLYKHDVYTHTEPKIFGGEKVKKGLASWACEPWCDRLCEEKPFKQMMVGIGWVGTCIGK